MQPVPDTGRRLALLVATSVYSDPDLRELRAPGRDAAELSEVLGDLRIGGFEVQMLVNVPSGEVQEGIEDFCADRHLDDQLLIYLSCHGVLDSNGRLYYAAANTKRQRLAATAISATWLNERLEDSRARRQILVLDCCHSGAFARGGKGDQELALQQRFEPHGRGRVVLTASRSTEYSFEAGQASGEGVPSVFTNAIVNGLRTGDADRDKDGLITVTELYQYVYENVRATEPRQTPELWTYGAEGDLLVAHSIRGAIIEPEPLPEYLRVTLENPSLRVRETGVAEIAELLDTARPSLALAARQALERIAEEDHPQVADLARIAIRASAGEASDQVHRERTDRAHREHQERQEAARRRAEEAQRKTQEEAARRQAEDAQRKTQEEAAPQQARTQDQHKAREEAARRLGSWG
jgi:Caspase domain